MLSVLFSPHVVEQLCGKVLDGETKLVGQVRPVVILRFFSRTLRNPEHIS